MKISHNKQLVLVLSGACLCFALLFSCSPAKKVSRQINNNAELADKITQAKKEECNRCVNEWITNNPPQLIPAFNLDSICDTEYIHDTVTTKTEINVPYAIPSRPKKIRIAVPYRDIRYEKILRDSFNFYKDKYNRELLVTSIAYSNEEKKLNNKIKAKNKWLWVLGIWGLLSAILLFMFIYALIGGVKMEKNGK